MCAIVEIGKKTISKLSIAVPTYLPCNILHMQILQLSQSPSCRPTTNNNPLTLQHQILPRWQTHQPQQRRIRVFRLHLVVLQKTKEGQKDRHCHTNGFGWRKALPPLCRSSYCTKNQRISTHDSKYPHFCNHDQQQDHAHHVSKCHRCTPRCCGSNWRTLTWHQQGRNWNALK